MVWGGWLTVDRRLANRAADVKCHIERTSSGDGDEEGVGEGVNSTTSESLGRESGGKVGQRLGAVVQVW